MLETSRIWSGVFGGSRAAPALLALALAACATVEPPAAPETPAPAPSASAAPSPVPAPDARALAEEARAVLAQAETDIQRARARRALWSRAWQSLIAARAAQAASDPAAVLRHARRASELAELGLEQLAYPAVQYPAPVVEARADRSPRSPP